MSRLLPHCFLLSLIALPQPAAAATETAVSVDGSTSAAAISLTSLCALVDPGTDGSSTQRWWSAANAYLVLRGARPGSVFDQGIEGLSAMVEVATASSAPRLVRALPPLAAGGGAAGLFDATIPGAAADAAALAKREFWLDSGSPEVGRLLGLPPPSRGAGRFTARVFGEALTAWERRFLELDDDRAQPAGALWTTLVSATYAARGDCLAARRELAARAAAWSAELVGQMCGELDISRVFAAGCEDEDEEED